MSPIYVPGKVVLAKEFTWNETVWNPSMISTALWLDANDAATITKDGSDLVSVWADKSGNTGRNATAASTARPTYQATGLDSKPTLSFNGTSNYLASAISGIAAFTALEVYHVVQTTNAAAANVNSGFFWCYGTFDFPLRVLSLTSSSGLLSGETLVFAREQGTGGPRLGSSTYSRPANTPQILSTSAATSGVSIFANGSSVTLDLSNASLTTTANVSPASIGYTTTNNLVFAAINEGTAISPALKYSEIICRNVVSSTLDRQRIEGYLAHKWGLTANLPSDHPYKTVGPTP